MPQENTIEFKGTKKGIYILIKELKDFETIKEEMIRRLEETKTFFKGAKILDIQCDTLSSQEKEQLSVLMKERYQMEIQTEVLGSGQVPRIFQGIHEGITKFHGGTLRSGQKINYEGNVVIVGDVNPGAEVVAQGNIIVMGNLRGIAHAGSNGNQEAFVVAYHLDPTQLRIADLIARAPDGAYEKPKGPEMARIIDRVVLIEPYLLRR